jgi:hypothetical protein
MTTQGIQEWIVPTSGTYTFIIAGAKGGDSGVSGYVGGQGRVVTVSCSLMIGQVVKILVGQTGASFAGGTQSGSGGSGGGGSYVSSAGAIIGIGGGGGGAQYQTYSGWGKGNGINAPDATYGTTYNGTASAQNGSGGGNNHYGGGGGGWLTDGTNNTPTTGLYGVAYANGGLGGRGYLYYNGANGGADGGFGGGAGLFMNSETCAGGGGGYSGGDSGTYNVNCGGGGGGSHLGVASISASYVTLNNGVGYVKVFRSA